MIYAGICGDSHLSAFSKKFMGCRMQGCFSLGNYIHPAETKGPSKLTAVSSLKYKRLVRQRNLMKTTQDRPHHIKDKMNNLTNLLSSAWMLDIQLQKSNVIGSIPASYQAVFLSMSFLPLSSIPHCMLSCFDLTHRHGTPMFVIVNTFSDSSTAFPF